MPRPVIPAIDELWKSVVPDILKVVDPTRLPFQGQIDYKFRFHG